MALFSPRGSIQYNIRIDIVNKVVADVRTPNPNHERKCNRQQTWTKQITERR